MPTNVFLAITLPESAELSWDTIKLIIQSQHSLAIIGISVLVGTALLIAGASWFTNFYLVRRELKNTIESLKSEVTTTAEEAFGKLIERMKDEVGKSKKEIQKSVRNELTLAFAGIARLHARDAEQEEDWELAALWWSRAIKDYAKGEQRAHPGILRVAVDGAVESLQNCKELGAKDREEIMSNLIFIPETLWREKDRIKDRIKKLAKEKPETT